MHPQPDFEVIWVNRLTMRITCFLGNTITLWYIALNTVCIFCMGGRASLDFLDLQLFQQIVLRGHITEAAEVLSLAQPTASRRIQRVEHELQTKLFDRTVSPMALTEEGMVFLEFCDHVVLRYQTMLEQLGQSTHMSGTLRLATSTTPGARLVTDWVRSFVENYPEVQVRMTLMDSKAVLGLVQTRQVMVGFVGFVPKDQSIARVAIAQDEIVLGVPLNPEFRHIDESIPMDHVYQLPFIARETGSGTQQTVEQLLKENGAWMPFHSVLEVDSLASLISAIQAGMGVGFLSRAVINTTPGIRAVSVRDLDFTRQLYMIYDPEKMKRAPIVKAFIDFVARQSVREGSEGP